MSKKNEEGKIPYHSDEVEHEMASTLVPSDLFSRMDERLKEFAGRVFQYIDAYDLNSLKSLISAAPQADITEIYNFQGRTVLHSAAIKNDESILDYLLSSVSPFGHNNKASKVEESKRRAWVNRATLKEGLTALHFTAWTGNIDALNTLVRHGADIHAVTQNGIGLMHIAAQADQSALLVSGISREV